MILVGLGANILSPAGPPAVTLRHALAALARKSVTVLAISPFYQSPAWPDPADPAFVNAVVRIAADASPDMLLKLLHEVETEFGRKRSLKNAPRALDLDLLDYHGRVEPGPPALPHRGLAARAFVLLPLRDIAPGWRHPVLGAGVDDLIAALPDAALAGVRVLKDCPPES